MLVFSSVPDVELVSVDHLVLEDIQTSIGDTESLPHRNSLQFMSDKARGSNLIKYRSKMAHRAKPFAAADFDVTKGYDELVTLQPQLDVGFVPTNVGPLKYYEITIKSLAKHHGGPSIGFAYRSLDNLPGVGAYSIGYALDSQIARFSFSDKPIVVNAKKPKIGETWGVGIIPRLFTSNHRITPHLTFFVTHQGNVIFQTNVSVQPIPMVPTIALYNHHDEILVNFSGTGHNKFLLSLDSPELIHLITSPDPSTGVATYPTGHVPRQLKQITVSEDELWASAGGLLSLTYVTFRELTAKYLSDGYLPILNAKHTCKIAIAEYFPNLHDLLTPEEMTNLTIGFINRIQDIGNPEHNPSESYQEITSVYRTEAHMDALAAALSYYSSTAPKMVIRGKSPDSLVYNGAHLPVSSASFAMIRGFRILTDVQNHRLRGIYQNIPILSSLLGGGPLIDMLARTTAELAFVERAQRLAWLGLPHRDPSATGLWPPPSYARLLDLMIPLTTLYIYPKLRPKIQEEQPLFFNQHHLCGLFDSLPQLTTVAFTWESFICTPITPSHNIPSVYGPIWIPQDREAAFVAAMQNIAIEPIVIAGSPLSQPYKNYRQIHISNLDSLATQIESSPMFDFAPLKCLHSPHFGRGWLSKLPSINGPAVNWDDLSKKHAIRLGIWHCRALLWLFGPSAEVQSLLDRFIALKGPVSVHKTTQTAGNHPTPSVLPSEAPIKTDNAPYIEITQVVPSQKPYSYAVIFGCVGIVVALATFAVVRRKSSQK